MHPRRKVLSALIAGLLSHTAYAGTAYVETFADPASTDCTKTNPCDSVQKGINSVGPNGRVNVGPGHYIGSFNVTASKPGVKILSSAGATGTILHSASGPIGYIWADRVVLGQRSKGFTLTGNFNISPYRIIQVIADKVRVEGNIFLGSSGAADGVWLAGKGATVRGNRLDAMRVGIRLDGGSPYGKERFQVSGNTIQANDDCILVESGIANANRIQDNWLTCDADGIEVNNNDSHSAKTGDRYQKNVIQTASSSSGIRVERGNPRIHRNHVKDGLLGVYAVQTNGAKITDNLLTDNDSNGVAVFDTAKPQVSGNTITGGETYTTQISISAMSPMTVQNNNVLTPIGCPIYVSPLVPGNFKLKRNFWGDPLDTDGIPDFSGCGMAMEDAIINGDVSINPSNTIRPIKYKSPL